MILVSLTTGIFLPELGLVITLTGLVSSTVVGFVIPVLIIFKVRLSKCILCCLLFFLFLSFFFNVQTFSFFRFYPNFPYFCTFNIFLLFVWIRKIVKFIGKKVKTFRSVKRDFTSCFRQRLPVKKCVEKFMNIVFPILILLFGVVGFFIGTPLAVIDSITKSK